MSNLPPNRSQAEPPLPAPDALAGLRVLDAATYLAGPFCATLLGEFGAEVIKIEQPGAGDPLRRLGASWQGHGLFWLQESRNKQSITLNFREARGQALLKALVRQADVLIENFRPGTFERWGLGPEELHAVNPGLIMVRISAYGQSGPMREQIGFGRIAQAFGGLAYLSGHPDRPPVNPGTPTLADYAAGLFGAFATLVAKQHRDRTGEGQVVDISLFESVFRLLDNLAICYDRLGEVRQRMGSDTPHAVPHNHYPAADGWVAIACTNDRMWGRLCAAMGRPELADDPRYAEAPARLARREEVDALVAEWTRGWSQHELVAHLERHHAPVSPINSIADIFADPQFAARRAIGEIADPALGAVRMAGIVPHLSRTPGRLDTLGPALGVDNREVYRALLGLGDAELAELAEAGII